MIFCKYFVINSSKETQQKEEIPVDFFKLNKESAEGPALFEVVFIFKNIRYRYGFEITKSKIINEWLFAKYTNRETKLFIRKGQKFDIGYKFKEGKVIDNKTRENALFLSVSAQFNGQIAKEVLSWFSKVHVIAGTFSPSIQLTINILGEKTSNEKKEKLETILKLADFNIDDFEIVSKKVSNKEFFKDMPFELKFKDNFIKTIKSDKELDTFIQRDIKTKHKRFSKDYKNFDYIEFDLKKEESKGTRRFFELAGPVINTLLDGDILFIDEIESSMHPLLVLALLKIINSKKGNPKKAQFIFTTHNTQILSKNLLRRDQLVFLEKNKYGETEIFSLADFKGYRVRTDASYEKDYIAGKYGAVPILKELENYFTK
jgi:uncharacterized protein